MGKGSSKQKPKKKETKKRQRMVRLSPKAGTRAWALPTPLTETERRDKETAIRQRSRVITIAEMERVWMAYHTAESDAQRAAIQGFYDQVVFEREQQKHATTVGLIRESGFAHDFPIESEEEFLVALAAVTHPGEEDPDIGTLVGKFYHFADGQWHENAPPKTKSEEEEESDADSENG